MTHRPGDSAVEAAADAAAGAALAAAVGMAAAGQPADTGVDSKAAVREDTAAACPPVDQRRWRDLRKLALLGQCKAVPYMARMAAHLAALAKPVRSLDPAVPPASLADKPARIQGLAARFRWAALAAVR